MKKLMLSIVLMFGFVGSSFALGPAIVFVPLFLGVSTEVVVDYGKEATGCENVMIAVHKGPASGGYDTKITKCEADSK